MELIGIILKNRVDDFERYLKSMVEKMGITTILYWKKFGNLNPVTDSTGTNNSLYVFPGSNQCRNHIKFEKVDRQECTKVYFNEDSTVSSFLTVQCSCAHPKLIGFEVLMECDSIAATISSLLTHFPSSRRVLYDNACNSYDSAILRVPWLLRWTMLVVDRFHFTGHL